MCEGPREHDFPISPFASFVASVATPATSPPWLGVLWPRRPVFVTVALTRTKVSGEQYAGAYLEEDPAVPEARMLAVNGWMGVFRLPNQRPGCCLRLLFRIKALGWGWD